MSTLSDRDYINKLEKAIIDYIVLKLNGDIYSTVTAGFPNFTDKLPLDKVHITVCCDDSTITASGYDDAISSENGEKLRAKIVEAPVSIDVWTSRGIPTNYSKSGGKTGCNKYFSNIASLFTIDESSFYDMYPDADIIEFRHQYVNEPDSADAADIYQSHGQLTISFPFDI